MNDIYTTIVRMLQIAPAKATWVIAAELKVETVRVRRLLKKMESDGVVKKHKFTSCNNIVWELNQ